MDDDSFRSQDGFKHIPGKYPATDGSAWRTTHGFFFLFFCVYALRVWLRCIDVTSTMGFMIEGMDWFGLVGG